MRIQPFTSKLTWIALCGTRDLDKKPYDADKILAKHFTPKTWRIIFWRMPCHTKIGPLKSVRLDRFWQKVFAKVDPPDYFCCRKDLSCRTNFSMFPLCQFWSPCKKYFQVAQVCMLASCNTILPVTLVFNTNEASWRSSLNVYR